MATATSSYGNSRVADLVRSGSEFPENLGSALKAREVVEGLCRILVPILKYVTSEVEVFPPGKSGWCYEEFGRRDAKILRAAPLLNVDSGDDLHEKGSRWLFLGRDGKFFVALVCPNAGGVHYHQMNISVVTDTAEAGQFLNTWELAPFDAIVESLQRLLAKVTEKQRRHLLTTERRDRMMDEMMEVIHRYRGGADPQ